MNGRESIFDARNRADEAIIRVRKMYQDRINARKKLEEAMRRRVDERLKEIQAQKDRAAQLVRDNEAADKAEEEIAIESLYCCNFVKR